MKQEMSALMDGELFDDEADAFLDRIRRHSQIQHDWDTYHLIGDVLRQPNHLCEGVSASFHERMQAEPTIFAPQRRNSQRVRNYALSAAASVMALALVAWLSLQVGTEPAPQFASAPVMQSGNAIKPASAQVEDYLMAHREFSPSAEVHGAASYIHAVSGR